MVEIALKIKSPLGEGARLERSGVTIAEDAGFTLTQLSGSESALKKALGKLPAKVGKVAELNDCKVFRVGPEQFWVIGAPPAAADGVYVMPLSSGRCRIALSGEKSRAVLAACAAIDFHPSTFKPGHFVMTGIHHTPVLIHCTGENLFHVYAMRSFAQAVWEWLTDAAEGVSLDARHP